MSYNTQPDILFTKKHYTSTIGCNNDHSLENQLEVIQGIDDLLPSRLRYDQQFMVPFGNHQVPGCGHSQWSDEYRNCCNPNGTPVQTKAFQTNAPDVYLHHDFMYGRGMMQDRTQIRRYATYFLNINSKFRVKKTTLCVSDTCVLQCDPLKFTAHSSEIFISHPKHSFEPGDQITLTNAHGKLATLRTIPTPGQETFVIPKGANFMKIYFPHMLPLDYQGNDVKIVLEGIRGDHGTGSVFTHLGNIPINLLNTVHTWQNTVHVTDPTLLASLPPGFLEPSEDSFFIILNRKMQENYTLQDYNFRLRFLSISNIPLNHINSQYPISPVHVHGYHIIKDTHKDGYTIDIGIHSITTNHGGGKCVTIGSVECVNPAYPNPNCYSIDIGHTYHNIVSARMVSSEIPNTERIIKCAPDKRANNKIYWNTVADGDTVYHLNVPAGNYTPVELAEAIEQQFAKTPRGDDPKSGHVVKVTIDTQTDEVKFSMFRKSALIEPIINVSPPIPLDPDQPMDPAAHYVVLIEHPNHGMMDGGEEIIIQGMISHLGILVDVLNGSHVVTNIVDDDHYEITLPSLNLLSDREETRGGASVLVYVPELFRLMFNKPDTLGPILGFRNYGDPMSVTPYKYVVSNKDLYAHEPIDDHMCLPKYAHNHALKMCGDNYIIMVAEPLETFTSIGPIKNAFAKILLCDLPGRVLFNTFVPTVHHFKDPLHELSSLDIKFYTPDGYLFDFSGCDHSFTIELVTVGDIPEGSGLSADTGKNYNLVVNQ